MSKYSNCYIKLKTLRLKRCLTMDDMAKVLGISKTYYFQIENKERRLYYHMAVRIAQIFKMRPDDIFYDDYKSMK